MKSPYNKKVPPIQHNNIKKIINSSSIFPKHVALADDIGKSGLMWPRSIANDHSAANLLHYYSSHGCPVNCGPNWTLEHILAAIKRGPHISAKSKTASQCLHTETQNKIEGGYATIVKWKDIKHDIPTNLKISPVAMIPHKSRKFRCILDLSYQLRHKGRLLPSVNSATVKIAPQQAMANLGDTLKRIVTTMATHHNDNLPFMFSKCDIKDGFWRMVVNKNDAWNFCYVLPSREGTNNIDETQIVVPHSLQMGWSESPPFFCAATETSRDIIQKYLDEDYKLPPHPLENDLLQSVNFNNANNTNPINIIEVYVDDFIGCTNELSKENLERFSRALLHGIHCLFPPPSVSQHKGGDPISEKKLKQGDGLWHFEKEILGWIFDGINYTIRLPDSKQKTIIKHIKSILKKDNAPLLSYQEMAGKLNHAAFGLPGGRGLFSPIYAAMRESPEHIPITPILRSSLTDWIALVHQMSTRPTSVLELVPNTPNFIGYVDASGFGAGGVWLQGTTHIQPHVWRLPFPQDITDRLVSFKNKSGDITNSDLEMAGVLLQWLVLEHISPCSLKFAHVGIYSDNTPTVAWATRLTSSSSSIAGHLLRALALRQHIHQTSPLLTVSIKGHSNKMADVASRSFRDNSFKSKPFLTTFSHQFPLPQNTCWKEFRLPEKWSSRVISCLRGKALPMASWTKITRQERNIGLAGPAILKPSAKAPTSQTAQKRSKSSSSQLSLRGCGRATTVSAIASELKPLQTRFLPYQRQLNWQDCPPRSTKQRKLTKSQWLGSSKGIGERTLQRSPNWQSRSVFPPIAGTPPTTATAKEHKPSAISPSSRSSISSELENTLSQASPPGTTQLFAPPVLSNSQLETQGSSATTGSLHETAPCQHF
jgi:hypothetical protein